MHVVIMMVPLPAVIATKGITRGIIRSRDRMHDAFFQEGLQGPVHGHPVQLIPGMGFDVSMRQAFAAAQKDLQDAAAHPGHAETMPF